MNGQQVLSAPDACFDLHSERLGPLPLVNAFLQRMGLEALLDKFVPTTDRRNAVPHAQALGVLLRSIIVEREPVYRQPETVCGFAPGLFGVSVVAMERSGRWQRQLNAWRPWSAWPQGGVQLRSWHDVPPIGTRFARQF